VARNAVTRDILPADEVALDARVVAVGVWLFLAANLFFFAAWYFAFFYLRALNNNQAWKPQGVGPPSRAYGLIVLALTLITAACYWLASRPPIRRATFQVLGPVALVVGVATLLFQGYEMWHLGFGMTQGGYPSVFAGLTGSWLIEFLFAVGWLATIVVQARPLGDTMVRPQSAAAFSWVLLFLAGAAVINFLLLYLVA
jgi:heme/copper-type cytochrome/quinol oxidase subunit 3